MPRYNHGTIERKWAKHHRELTLDHKTIRACTALIPRKSGELDLENARLLILTDFFASIEDEASCQISILNFQECWQEDLNKLAYFSWNTQQTDKCNLALIPRDYAHLVAREILQASKTLYCGRLLMAGSLGELLPDFGLDSLRLYFLNMGPLDRDYTFNWNGLVSAYRFVNKVWQFGQSCTDSTFDAFEQNALWDLRETVHYRLLHQKPHTALAAIMGYIKNRITLTKNEICTIAKLLQPFTPFLSAELLALMTSIQD